MISGEIKRFLRDDGMIKVSRSLKELSYKSLQAREKLTARLGREPNMEELSCELGVDKEELVQAMEAGGEVESTLPSDPPEGGKRNPSCWIKLRKKKNRRIRFWTCMVFGQLLETLDAKRDAG